MSAEVWNRHEEVYSAYCESCDWEGEVYLDESEAESEVKLHNKTCQSAEEEDNRTEREIFQDALDAAVRGDHLGNIQDHY